MTIEKLAEKIVDSTFDCSSFAPSDSTRKAACRAVAALLREVPVEPGDDALILEALDLAEMTERNDADTEYESYYGEPRKANLLKHADLLHSVADRFRLRSLREGELLKVLHQGIVMVESSVSHVIPSGTTIPEAEVWLSAARKLGGK